MENKGIKRSFNYLSNLETGYNTVKNTPYFNQDDWDILSKRSEDELYSYLSLVSQYDKLPDYDEANDKYYFDQMDVDQKSLFMYKELYADDEEVKSWNVVTGYDDAGKEIKQKMELTEKQYYDKLFNDWATYAKEQQIILEETYNKANAGFWGNVELTIGSVAATGAEFLYGVLEMGHNVINIVDALLHSSWDTIGAIGSGNAVNIGLDKFREYMSDSNLFADINVGNIEDLYSELLDWERHNTYYMEIDGTRTTAGKLFGDTARSIGPIAITAIATYALGPAGAGLSSSTAGGIANAVYYGSAAAGDMRERFRDPKFNSTPTELIVLETGVRTAADIAIERTLGKAFGETQMDVLRGVTGVGKAASGFKRYVLDALQEGFEELTQEFSGWAVENFVGLFRDEYKSELNMSTLIDAAMGGVMSSLILGGFAEVRKAAYDNKLSKAYAAFDLNYHELGNGTDKETADQRKYRKNMLEFRRTQAEIQNVGTPKIVTVSKPLSASSKFKLGDTGHGITLSKRYGLSAINDTYKEIANDIDTSTDAGRKLLAQLNLQLFTSYKLIMDMYGEFGAERMVAAEKMLNDMNIYADKKRAGIENAKNVTLEGSKSFANSLSNQIDNLLSDKQSFDSERADKIKNATEKIASKDKRTKPKTTKEAFKKSNVKDATKSTFTENESAPIKSKGAKLDGSLNDVLEKRILSMVPTDIVDTIRRRHPEYKDKKSVDVIMDYFVYSNKYAADYDIYTDTNLAEFRSLFGISTKPKTTKEGSVYCLSVGKDIVGNNYTDTAREIAEKYDGDFVIMDVDEVQIMDDILFIDPKSASTLSSDDLIKTAVENELIQHTTELLPKQFIQELRLLYGEFANNYLVPDKVIVTNVLFNKRFYNFALNSARHYTIFNILKTLDNFTLTLSDKLNNRTKYFEAVKRVRSTIGPVLAWYCMTHFNIDLENVTVFSKEQLKYIQEHRVNYGNLKAVLTGDTRNPDYEREVSHLINMIKSSNMPAKEQQKFVDKVYGRTITVSDYEAIYKQANIGYTSNRLPSWDYSHAIFNTLLDEYKIGVSDILNSYIANDKMFNTYTEAFRQLTNNTIGFEVAVKNNGKYELVFYSLYGDNTSKKQVNKYQIADDKGNTFDVDVYDVYDVFSYYTDAVRDTLTKYNIAELDGLRVGPNDNNSVIAELKNLLNVDDLTSTYLSVTDLILNPTKYFDDDTLKSISKFDKGLTSAAVIQFLNIYLSDKGYRLSRRRDGGISILNLQSFEDAFGKSEKELCAQIVDLLKHNVKTNESGKYVLPNDGTSLHYDDVNFSIQFADLLDTDNAYNQYISKLLDIRIRFTMDKSNSLEHRIKGEANADNGITLYVNNMYDVHDLVDVLWHEFTHFVQDRLGLSLGADLFKFDDAVVKDILSHLYSDEELAEYVNGSADERADITKRVMIDVYKRSEGEINARGENVDELPFIMHNDLFIAPYGSVYIKSGKQYKLYKGKLPIGSAIASGTNLSLGSDIASDVIVVKKGDKKVPKYDELVKYKKAIDKALEIIKLNIKNDIKTTAKDLSNLGLPGNIKKQLLRGEYKKGDDETYKLAQTEIRRAEKKGVRETRAKQRRSNKYTSNGTRLFKKNVEGTNLMNWVNKNPEGAPYLSTAAQKFVRDADIDQLPDVLRNAINNATLTDSTIYDYVRDAYNEGMSQYVFDLLKNSYFRRTPFKSFEQLVDFVQSNIVMNGYALDAAFKAVNMEDYSTDLLSKDVDAFVAKVKVLPKLFEQGLSTGNESNKKIYEKLLSVYTDVLDRFESTVYKKSVSTKVAEQDGKQVQPKKRKSNEDIIVESTLAKTFDISDAHQDILLGLLNYFRGTISDIAYVAGNAKSALTKELRYNEPFTYKGKKDISKQKSTVSLDSTIKGKKGDDSDRDLSELIADEVKHVQLQNSEDDLSDLKRDIEEAIRNYLLQDINKMKRLGKTVNFEKIEKVAKKVYNTVRNYDYNEAVYRLALLNTRDVTKYSVYECLGLEISDFKNKEVVKVDKTSDVLKKIEKVDYNKALSRVRSNLNRLIDNTSANDYKYLPDNIKKYLVKDGKSFKYNSKELRSLSKEELDGLNEDLLDYKKAKRTKDFATNSATVKRMEKAIAKKDKEIERLKKKIDKTNKPTFYTADLLDGVTLTSAIPLSNKLKPLLKATFAHKRNSKMQFYAAESESKFVASGKDFFDINAETLASMTYDDAVEIVSYFESAASSNDDYTPYKSFQLFTMSWILEQINDGVWTDTEYLAERIEKRIMAIVENAAAVLGNWRGLIKKIKPKEQVMMSLGKQFSIIFTEEEIKPLTDALNAVERYSKEGTDPKAFKNAVNRLQQISKNLERMVIEKARKESKDGKLTKLDYIKWYNRILKFQKAAMLSAPATIVRNALSNIIISGFDYKGKHIWGMNDLSDWIGSFFTKSVKGAENTPENQYDFKGVKVTTKTMTFIKEYILESGLLDLTSDGLTKYDPRKVNGNTTTEDQLTDMIVKSISSRIINEHTYGKGEFTTWLEGKTGKEYEYGVLDNVVNAIFRVQSDNKHIQKLAVRYLGKMLEVNKVDLSNGVNTNVMSTIADAYTMAAWDVMHRSNFFSDIENTFQKKWPSAHFAYKLILPFTSSTWNWFLDALQMNPIALFNNIRKLNNLEKVVNKMEDRRQRGDTSIPDSRFAEMIVRRNIGRGVLGTLLWVVGAGMAALGKLQVDEEDDKMKLRIGNTWFDISAMYGTSSLLVGAAFVSSSEDGSWFTVVESALNQQFDDSILTTLMNAFRYNNTPADYLLSLPKTIASGFIPNVWKQAVNLTRNKTVKYNNNRIIGDLQYLAMQSIPFFENAMEPAIDPYTGEQEMRYSIPAVHQLITLLGSPISVKTYDIGDIEAICRANGVSKQMLKGVYDDIGSVDRVTLNKFYGSLNNKRIEEFVNGFTKYSVETKDGVTKELTYKQMTYEQRKSVLNRITTQNANYAKIYAWTEAGHKYYCNSAKRNELIKLGIKNVYVGSKEKFAK